MSEVAHKGLRNGSHKEGHKMNDSHQNLSDEARRISHEGRHKHRRDDQKDNKKILTNNNPVGSPTNHSNNSPCFMMSGGTGSSSTPPPYSQRIDPHSPHARSSRSRPPYTKKHKSRHGNRQRF